MMKKQLAALFCSGMAIGLDIASSVTSVPLPIRYGFLTGAGLFALAGLFLAFSSRK